MSTIKPMYGIIIFCTSIALSTFCKPKKETMPYAVRMIPTPQQHISGMEYALACACTGLCCGTMARLSGYDCGPCDGWIIGSISSLSLPLVLRAREYVRYGRQKQD